MNKWQPSAPLSHLKLRAQLLKNIRSFFESKNVLEVETPLVAHTSVTDPSLSSFDTLLTFNGKASKKLYLQTSPEFAMKRLIAAGYGSIYQICKAFRNGEVSKKHNPEFTILEWYQLDYDHHRLMDETDELLHFLLNTKPAERISYLELFETNFSVNPHTCSVKKLQQVARKNDLVFDSSDEDKDIWLDLIMTHLIEPKLGFSHPVFIYDYPATQAALAKIRQENNYKVGERFEVYYQGLELANGYHELGDPEEQLRRFTHDNEVRAKLNLPTLPLDTHLLSALSSFPACAGIAVGIDRLLCIAANSTDISDIIAFPITRA